MLDGASAQFSRVQATTHPFHYDSICLNGLGCDLAVTPGDRSLADSFAITYNQQDGKLSVVFDRGNKKPDDASGYVATPMVVTQIAGPSNGGGAVTARNPVLRSSTTDPTGDALANYSLTAAGTEPPPPPTTNPRGRNDHARRPGVRAAPALRHRPVRPPDAGRGRRRLALLRRHRVLFANSQAAPSPTMSWMDQLDNTPAMDFLLPAAATPTAGGGSGGGGGGSSSGGGSGSGGTTAGSGSGSGSGVKGGQKTVTHAVVLRGLVRALLSTFVARAWINRTSVLYVDRHAKLRFRSTKVTSVVIRGRSATLRGVGVRNGHAGVRFRVVLVAANPATLHVWFGTYIRSGRLVSGTAIVR